MDWITYHPLSKYLQALLTGVPPCGIWAKKFESTTPFEVQTRTSKGFEDARSRSKWSSWPRVIYFGHIARRFLDNLDKLIFVGNVEGKWPQGRSPSRCSDQVKLLTGLSQYLSEKQKAEMHGGTMLRTWQRNCSAAFCNQDGRHTGGGTTKGQEGSIKYGLCNLCLMLLS